MPDNAHDPPAGPRNYQPEPPIPSEALAPLRGPGHEKYALMTARLNAEPLEVVRTMKHGGFRFKSKRGYPGVLVLDRDGNPVPDRMSFRQIAPILSASTGVEVTYETVRRWWEAVFPGEPDEATDPDDPPVRVVPTSALTPTVKRATRRRTVAPVVGDEAADAIRDAMERAKSTNPDVPPAAFLPPADTQ
jgi:hypothetical protein